MRRTHRLALTAGALTLASLAAFGAAPSDFYQVVPGPTPTVPDATTVQGPVAGNPHPASGAIHITTIAAHRLNHWDAFTCQLRNPCTAIARTKQGYTGAETEQMSASVIAADKAATNLAGSLAQWPAAPGTISVDGIGGPSAGLAMTLQLLQDRVPGDLTAGKVIATTGTIDARGNVGPVGGVQYKARGAATAHAEVFFVPADEANQVPADSGLTVVPVTTAHDAVRWLCNHGSTSSLCGPRDDA